MPQLTYTEAEVYALVRLAYTTGIRDAIVTAQGHPLNAAQEELVRGFLTDRDALREMYARILPLARVLSRAEGETRPHC